jgi:hypothetical protein
MGLLQIASPLRYGRSYGVASACLVFLLALADVEATLYAVSTAMRLPVDLFSPDYQSGALPIAGTVALATTVAFGVLLRRRALRLHP